VLTRLRLVLFEDEGALCGAVCVVMCIAVCVDSLAPGLACRCEGEERVLG